MKTLAILTVGALCACAHASEVLDPKPGEVRIVAGFSTNSVARVYRDFPLAGGMEDVDGIEFDFRCDGLAAFSSFTLYFKSGNGWYLAKFAPEHNGKWTHMKIGKRAAADSEGKPSGWKDVTVFRVCGWRGTNRDAVIRIADIKTYKVDAKVVVLRTASDSSSGVWAGKVASTLSALGVASRQVSDSDLKDSDLKGIRFVTLPHNPRLTKGSADLLKGYVSGGGKLLVCYLLPKEVSGLIGVKNCGSFVPDSAANAIAGFLRTGSGLEGQPEFSPQGSWRAVRAEPLAGGEVVACWAGKDGGGQHRSLGVPALIRTPSGLYMSHIWCGGTSGAPLKLMQSIVGTLAPDLKGTMVEKTRDVERRLAEQRREAKRIGLKPGEWRGVWCHTPYGCDAEHDWEVSTRLMKENGYTDLIANLCWGGMAFYRSDVLPVSPEVEVNGDALDLCLAACRRNGIRLHVWKVCWRMNSKVSAKYRADMRAAGRTQVHFNGKDNKDWLCPSNPENQREEVETMLELARRGVDGVHFDYIRYPNADGCFCPGCRKRFEEKYGVNVEKWPAAIRKDADLAAKWHDFRCDNISKVVKEVAERLHGHSKVQISAAVFNMVDSCHNTVGQDWATWCRNGWLDFVCPMDYTKSADLFDGIVRHQMEVTGQVKVYPGIGLSCWPDDGENLRRLGEHIEIVRKLGLSGFTVFALGSRSLAAFPAFR